MSVCAHNKAQQPTTDKVSEVQAGLNVVRQAPGTASALRTRCPVGPVHCRHLLDTPIQAGLPFTLVYPHCLPVPAPLALYSNQHFTNARTPHLHTPEHAHPALQRREHLPLHARPHALHGLPQALHVDVLTDGAPCVALGRREYGCGSGRRQGRRRSLEQEATREAQFNTGQTRNATIPTCIPAKRCNTTPDSSLPVLRACPPASRCQTPHPMCGAVAAA